MHTRFELYHWAEGHRFFMEGALAHLVEDWKLCKRRRQALATLVRKVRRHGSR